MRKRYNPNESITRARSSRRLGTRQTLIGWTFRVAASGVLLALSAGVAFSHDLFLRPVKFFVDPGAEIVIRIMNGTFSTSEGAVGRGRPRDLRIVGPSSTVNPDTTSMEVGKTETLWRVRAPAPGTYVIGMSLLPRTIKLDAKDFNEYLASDGIPSILDLRRKTGEMDSPASERYAKHVKALVQVGSLRSVKVDHVFGYPAEIVALDNPFRLGAGKAMRVRLMVDGKAVAGQTVIMGGRADSGRIYKERTLRSGSDGVATIVPPAPGKWYAKFISMKPMKGQPSDSVDYESKWATLTFAVK